MAEWLKEQWHMLTTSEVWGLWNDPQPIIDGITKESGVFDDGLLEVKMDSILNQLGDMFGPTFKRMINIDAMDANTGTFTKFTEKTNTYNEFGEITIASSSIPFVFPATKWGNSVFIDGGVVYSADLSSGVQRCREIVDDDSNITVDIVITHARKKDRF